MPYQVSRDGQTYGPYTIDDLRRYLTSGNILPSDMAKSEEMADWQPVSQILAAHAPTAPSAIPYQPAPPAYNPAYAASAFPPPPNLHWALVLLFGILTCGLFLVIWDLIQALWAKRVEPTTQALTLFIVYVVAWLANMAGSISRAAVALHGGTPRTSVAAIVLSLAVLALVITYRFVMRATLEQHFNGPDPIGLRLGPIMTFFFGGLYFQYHFNRINQIKLAASGYRPY